MRPDFITPALKALQERSFLSRGFDVRAVGGCVRDSLLGKTPKDIDLCTDATPEEQIALYEADGVRYFTTGLQHGTITVKLGPELYEITSLRGEKDHDGRHATVYYHRDWIADLGRRDLTINAMAMTLDGQLVDPHGGRDDLEAGRVRFVGEAATRIREDYLRILRFLRFHARFSSTLALDETAESAIELLGQGLKGISRERVWSEMSRIVTGPRAGEMLRHMMRLKLNYACDVRHGAWREVDAVVGTVDAVATMVAYLIDPEDVRDLATAWRWSRMERIRGIFLAEHLHEDVDLFRMVARDGIDLAWALDLARLRRDTEGADKLAAWDIPVFPLKGGDLVAAGHAPGPRIGQLVDSLRSLWADTGFTMDRVSLLEHAKP